MRLPRSLGALFLLFAACTATQSPTQAPPPVPAAQTTQTQAPEPAEAAILRLLAQQAEDWNRHDAQAWAAPFSEDAEFINILGTLLDGRDEIALRHAEIFKAIFARSRVVVTVRKVRRLAPTAAVAETDYELRDYDRLPPGIQPTDADGTLRTRLKYVFSLAPTGWRIVTAQNTAIVPPRPPAP